MKRLLLPLLLLLSPLVHADLTAPQMTTLLAHIKIVPAIASCAAVANDPCVADYLNAPTAAVAWRSAISPDETRLAIVQGAVQLDNLTAGKRDSLLYLAQGTLKTNDASVRQAIDDLTGTQTTLKNALLAAMKRIASKAEALLATGTGTTASPATLSYEGSVSLNEIGRMLRNDDGTPK